MKRQKKTLNKLSECLVGNRQWSNFIIQSDKLNNRKQGTLKSAKDKHLKIINIID